LQSTSQSGFAYWHDIFETIPHRKSSLKKFE